MGNSNLYLGVSPGGISGCCYPVANVDARCRVSLNVWHHVAFVCDAVQARLYLDGTMVGGAAVSGAKVGRGHGVPTLGAVWRPPEEPRGSFIGSLHWLRISKVARYRGGSFIPPSAKPASDTNTLLTYPSNNALDRVHTGTGFVGATQPTTHWSE